MIPDVDGRGGNGSLLEKCCLFRDNERCASFVSIRELMFSLVLVKDVIFFFMSNDGCDDFLCR